MAISHIELSAVGVVVFSNGLFGTLERKGAERWGICSWLCFSSARVGGQKFPSSPQQITGPHTPLYTAQIATANDEFSNPGPEPGWKPCTGYPALHTHSFLSSSLLRANRETADSTGEAYLSMALCASADPTCRSFCHFHRFFSLGGGGTRKDHVSVTW